MHLIFEDGVKVSRVYSATAVYFCWAQYMEYMRAGFTLKYQVVVANVPQSQCAGLQPA